MKRLSYIIIICLFLVACSNDKKKTVSVTYHSNQIQSLWLETVTSVLNDNLWLDENAYDASNILMLPMHYAYSYPERFENDVTASFDMFFSEVAINFEPQNVSSRVARTQFLYFITQYLKLNSTKIDNSLYEQLFKLVESELVALWVEREATHWDRDLNFTGIKERLTWKLSTEDVEYSYYTAIIDEEWASLAALSDLIYLAKQQDITLSFDSDEVIILAEQIVMKFGEYKNQEFYIQNGFWRDHPDYKYAGNNAILPNLEVSKIDDIAIDSSHSHRLPLWYRSFHDVAYIPALFTQAVDGFSLAFSNKALKEESDNGSYMLLQTNYIDGNNGVYRYNYDTQGQGNGYGPYELSGTLLVGYYFYAETEKYQKGMKKLAQSFPLSPEALNFYVGPNTTRQRHPLFEWPAYFENGFAELFANLAACYEQQLVKCDDAAK